MLRVDLFRGLRREPAPCRRDERIERQPLQRVGRERTERLFGTNRAPDRAPRLLHPLVQHFGCVLERLALEEASQQQVALFEAEQLLVEIDVVSARQQAPRLELDQRRRDQQELGRDLEIDALHAVDLRAERVDDPHQRDLPEVDLFFQDQVQKEVEGAFEDRGRDLVAHAEQATGRESQSCGTSRHVPPKPAGHGGSRPVSCAAMARVFSGIKPTGETQLGNYLGAIRRWVDDQPPAGSPAALAQEAIFCVVDLHAMTAPWDPKELQQSTRHMATMLMAAGLTEDRSLLFVQSHVHAHTELTWLLNCVGTFGELRRMVQFKEKSEGAGVGQRRAVRLSRC